MAAGPESRPGSDDAGGAVVNLGAVTPGHSLMLPWSDDAPEVEVLYRGLAAEPITRRFRLAGDRVERWRIIPLPDTGDAPVVLSSANGAIAKARISTSLPALQGTVHGVVLPFGQTFGLLGATTSDGLTVVELACDLLGSGTSADVIRLASADRLNWQLEGVDLDAGARADLSRIPMASLPVAGGVLASLLGTIRHRPLESLRIWERRLGPSATGTVGVPLRFRVVPDTWPQIRLTAAEGTDTDVTAAAYELRLQFDPGDGGTLLIDVAGFKVHFAGRTVSAGGESFRVPGAGPISATLHLQGDVAALSVDLLEPRLLSAARPLGTAAAVPVTTNIAGFAIGSVRPSGGALKIGSPLQLLDAVLYGLREPQSATYRAATKSNDGLGELFYASSSFAVHDRGVVERAVGDPAAVVTGRHSIVSPIRVVEEFAWRDNPFGDMTRVVDRGEVWCSRVEPGRFPRLETSFDSVDAAFELALETFQRNSSGEFALPGEAEVWSAGYFQGPGLGFGSWRRDTCHVALRCGNLLGPGIARASLAHVTTEGFDNGADGDSLPAVAVWDYVLATGDDSLAMEAWAGLAANASALDSRFDESRGLVSAPQSTSNDCFPEPETDGYALSTEVYTMQTYAALAQMAALPGITDSRGAAWSERASRMRTAILDQYWNPLCGYFTSGPVGSESYDSGYWETSGIEAAAWGFLGSRAEPMVSSSLRQLRHVAMSEYGTILFPYKSPDNHFCGSVWYCWQAGIAAAAARCGDAGLVHQLIGQQVRTVVRNKTYYEVTDARTGHSWRWPGQLWHAAGFVSLILLGLLGIRYDLQGLTFTPAVAAQFDGARLRDLTYRGATLDIEIRGHGTRCELLVDGRPSDGIPATAIGRHSVVLVMR